MSAGGNSDHVELGPGRLWVAPLGTTEPTSASAALPSAWVAIGYTEDGSAYAADITSEPVEVAEELDPVKYENTRRLNRLTFQMAEATARNLVLALGGGAGQANDGSSVEPPTPGAEVAVMIVWDSEETAGADNVRWIYRQAKPSGTIEIAHRKAPGKTLIPVTFNLEKPASAKPWKVFPNAAGDIS
jgi:Ca2+-binding RTX toxin-like protein